MSDQRLALVEREVQLRRLERTVAGLVARLTGSREELRDLRSQHGDLSREADITRDRCGIIVICFLYEYLIKTPSLYSDCLVSWRRLAARWRPSLVSGRCSPRRWSSTRARW